MFYCNLGELLVKRDPVQPSAGQTTLTHSSKSMDLDCKIGKQGEAAPLVQSLDDEL